MKMMNSFLVSWRMYKKTRSRAISATATGTVYDAGLRSALLASGGFCTSRSWISYTTRESCVCGSKIEMR